MLLVSRRTSSPAGTDLQLLQRRVCKSEAAAKKGADQKFEASCRKSACSAERRISSGRQAKPGVCRPVDPLRLRPQTLIRGGPRKSYEGRRFFWHRDAAPKKNNPGDLYPSPAKDSTQEPLKMRRGAARSLRARPAPLFQQSGRAHPTGILTLPASGAAGEEIHLQSVRRRHTLCDTL